MNLLSKIPWRAIGKGVVTFTKKHSTTILTVCSCVGTVATAVVSAKSTPKALTLLEAAQMDKGEEPLTFKEKFKIAWKSYIPTAVCVAGTMACSIGSNVTSLKREAALISAYTLVQDAAQTYKDEVKESIGERKEKNIADRAAQKDISADKLERVERCHGVIHTGMGDDLMYDSSSDRYFRSSREALERAQIAIQKEINDDGYMSLNEVYDKMGLPNTDVGWLLGFNRYMRDCEFEFIYGSDLPTVGPAAIVVQFTDKPKPNYNKI